MTVKCNIFSVQQIKHSTGEVTDPAFFKIQRFKSISMFDFGIIDSALMRHLRNSYNSRLPKEAVVYQYAFCEEARPKDHQSNADKFAYQQIIARNQIFKTKFTNIGKSALLSCAFKCVLRADEQCLFIIIQLTNQLVLFQRS